MTRVLAGVAVAVSLVFCASATAADRIFWTVGPEVVVGNLDGSGTRSQFNTTGVTINSGSGITIDPKRRWLVVADIGANTLEYARLDGGGAAALTDGMPGGGTLFSGLTDVAVDSANDQMFVTNQTGTSLDRVPFDPNQAGSAFASDGTKTGTYGLVVDPSTQIVWWSSYSANTISHAHIPDGSGADLAHTGATVSSPRGVAIDRAGGRIFWANQGANTISFAKLDGSGGGNLSVGGATVNNPRGVAIDTVTRRIYWVNDAGSIAWASLDGGTGGNLFTTEIGARFAVIQRVPRMTGIPVVGGGSDAGTTLTCSDGTWLADAPEARMFAAPSAFAYQWTLNGADISGAGAPSITASQPGDYRCRVTASNEAGSSSVTSDPHTVTAPPVGPGPDGSNPGLTPVLLTAPVLSSLKRTHSVFALAKAATPLTGKTAAKAKKGTVFSFKLDKAATVTVVFRRKPPHRRSVKVGTLKRVAHAGLNKLAFSGRLRRKALKPAVYSATFTAKNSAGTSRAKTIGFKIVKR